MTNWAPWSQCSATCDFGVQFRNRSVVEVQTAKGICWNLTEIATCQIDSCVSLN